MQANMGKKNVANKLSPKQQSAKFSATDLIQPAFEFLGLT